jgi:hypothetical protein
LAHPDQRPVGRIRRAGGGRMRVDHHGDTLPAGGLEVEFDRASQVLPYQRELGGGATGEL